MKKQFALIAWITLIMTLLLSSCQKFEEDAIQKLAYGKDESGRHFVDLGLSVKWATCNIGAEAPEQQGLLYAWGETTPKEEYTWDNYKFGPDTALSKYCANPDVAWHGFTDTKTTLELSDDAAHVNWQGRWRMPTQAEWKELIEKCTWTQTEYMGVKGYDVKAANGNRIFLPAPDESALYASSSLLETRPAEALHLPIFDQYDVLTAQYRYRAYSVRAVYGSLLPQYSLITFDANGGEGIMHPQQFSKGALIPLTEVRFTKQASVFSSWNTKADGSGTSYKDKASIITDKSFTIYAQWTPCYTITFDANGGEGTMDSLTIVQGEEKQLPANTFTRSGYVFAAWNTKADGSGTAYKESSEIAPTENMTLYAQWTPCYTITFDANGGEGTMDSLTIVSGTKKPLPANTFTRSGYVFAGWNTAPDGSGTAYKESSEIAPTENMTLYAQWTPCYTITFDANGGKGSMAPQKAIKGEEFSISSNVFTREDYTFTGWNTAPDGSGTSYTDRQVVTLTEDITLYAQWDQRFYVSFEANGGTGEMEVQTFTSGEKKALLACTFANLGYLFSGWNTEADGSGTSYSDKQIISVTQDLTLYAQWKRGLYTVTFDANGGTGFMSAQTFEGGVSQALSTNVFTREGFLFDGWNTMADGSGTSYTDKEVISLTKDITLYAQWTGYENGHEWVDLGLPSGLKWATCNIGATTPEGYGDYFAWGETEPKSNYAWDNYKFGSSIETFNKYNSTDKKTILEPEDDAAHVNWGGNWRMPLSQDFKELLNNCTSVWTKVGDVNGYKLTSKINGNSIFLPAAGYKYDWNWVFENSYAFYRAADKERDGHSYGILGTYGDIIEEETLWMREACSIRPILGTGASVTFNANGGMGTMSEQRFEEGVSQQLSPNTFTRAGYTFVGWNTAADGSGTSYTDMQEISLTRNTTLFAQWKPYHEYYVTFDANGGEGEMEPQLFLYGIRKPLMENSFTREDYVFVEWNLEPDGSGTTYQDQELTSLYENITLYAQWAKSTYTLTFDANGGEGSMPAQKFEYGVSQSINTNLFTRDGYVFYGWNTASNGNGTSYTDQQEISITQDITLYAQWKLDASFGEENGYVWVDLGLPSGLKWATCNVGATSPEGYGDYFAWGETSPKNNYDWSTYKYCNGSNTSLTKYNANSSYGTIDNKNILELSDDAARVNWGGSWRMPTQSEQDELRNNCTWTWTTQNGVNGYKIASKTNGNSIFLPAAGYSNVTSVNNQVGSTGYYWSISLDGDSRNAHYLRISSYKVDGRQRQSRDSGLTVRAVCP